MNIIPVKRHEPLELSARDLRFLEPLASKRIGHVIPGDRVSMPSAIRCRLRLERDAPGCGIAASVGAKDRCREQPECFGVFPSMIQDVTAQSSGRRPVRPFWAQRSLDTADRPVLVFRIALVDRLGSPIGHI